ncbi:unnamed protein product [Brassica oleracea var. botrytis]|uniref:Uncharacterized protein n=3 Tax=Brassica TaxID=3705 RepID=A0A8S9QB54_BRACR|nr:hypothetical protein F2Q69_00020619 [Brassica cretica]
MRNLGKKSATEGEAPPAGGVKATKPLKKAKREPEDDDDLETKTNLKKQKKEGTETMEGLADRLQRIESKVDTLATKVDLLISVKGKRVHVKKSIKAKAEISSSEDELSSSDEDSKDKSVASVKVAAKVSSSSESDDEESDQGEKVEQRMANADIKIGVVSNSGRWPFGGRFSGGRCGGLGRCGRC